MEHFENDINASLATLKKGGIILYPTDTIWGLGCEATNETAIKKIYHLKKRAEQKSMIILLAAIEAIPGYVSKPSKKILDFLSKQTEPVTAIFDNAIHLPRELINDNGSIAIRITKNIFCQTLIKKLNKPLVSTSANVSGEPAPQNFIAVDEVIKNGVDFVVQHRQNDMKLYKPSSIIKLTEGQIEKIR